MTAKVKICGLKTKPAIDAALAEGADYLGLVFYPKSPRHLDVEMAGDLAAHARETGTAMIVALMVDPSDEAIARVLQAVNPDIIQLHGHEPLERVRQVRRLSQRPIIKALSVRTRADVSAAVGYLEPGAADIVLFDAKPPAGRQALPGGNGLAFDWTILDAAVLDVPFALAGGLTPQNVQEAIKRTRAAIVDVSSGVESAPGVKDADLIRLFIRNAKTAK
ncbi:MAG: phosphoribosylanthranilate isomerase [Burkholderiales bacterium]